ncbi:hypothetical protein SUGI_1194180 [Cryptomeria japonica]|nr:hypothetical protein SUGI_1194180 [Cryptomeria japonica]
MEMLCLLVFISLDFNYLTGPIPPYIGARLPHLEWLLLAENKINDNIPESLGNCYHLFHVEFAFNKFSGIILVELRKLSRLVILNMPSNEFVSGTTSGQISILEALSKCSKL